LRQWQAPLEQPVCCITRGFFLTFPSLFLTPRGKYLKCWKRSYGIIPMHLSNRLDKYSLEFGMAGMLPFDQISKKDFGSGMARVITHGAGRIHTILQYDPHSPCIYSNWK
jgi:hypothetical protein